MGDAYLNHFVKTYAYTDVTASNAPVRKAFDWNRSYQGVPVRNPRSQSISLEPSETLQVFSSLRSTSIANNTEFEVTPNPVDGTIYRFTYVSGTAPAFRTARNLTSIGLQEATFTRNPNSTATLSVGGGYFGVVSVGDTVFIPGVTTGDDAGPFSPLNEGFWIVLAVPSSDDLVLARPSGVVFEAASETVQLSDDSQIQAFSAAGVQVNDQVRITAGFSTPIRRTFAIYAVTPTWFEVLSSSPLPSETATPTTSGIAFYSSAKRFLRIEADQQVVVRLNGASGDEVMITPFVAGDAEQVGWFELGGTAFSLTLVNKSLVVASVEVFSAE